jgi:hypothetical protein
MKSEMQHETGSNGRSAEALLQLLHCELQLMASTACLSYYSSEEKTASMQVAARAVAAA